MTKYLFLTFIVISLFGCNRPNTDYYLSHRKQGTPFNRTHHYRLFKKEQDSIRLWILSHNYNGGYYSWKKSHAVPNRIGKFGIVEFSNIEENSIDCKITEGAIAYDLGRLYPVEEQEAYEILNILRMLQINHQMELFIDDMASCEKPNTSHLSINYSADEKCSELTPLEFEEYYCEKMKKEALEAIKKIDENCS